MRDGGKTMKGLAPWLLVACVAGGTLHAEGDARVPLGELLGRAVYRDELKSTEPARLGGELRRLFAAPLLEAYVEEHRGELKPTEQELAALREEADGRQRAQVPEIQRQIGAAEAELARPETPPARRQQLQFELAKLRHRLDGPSPQRVASRLERWKLQRAIYLKFGGGRVLWTPVTPEAFDATRRWLEQMERDGRFRLSDATLRQALYDYWDSPPPNIPLNDDRQRIEREFLHPEWEPRLAPAAAPAR
ncbi:MAG TPA: hypothetical protein VJS92_06570 [Candidatus Polarisedimenticolaceae bacterium]|nr:hypothetical protein [Candidatus Polarisedimenticolaceae bacterium]